MSTDTGPRKRNKDKKRKKGSVGEANVGIGVQRDIPAMKLLTEETIHVHKDVNVGGNILSKLIFVSVFVLLGVSLIFIWTEYKGFEGDGNETQLAWLTQLLNYSYFTDQKPDQPPDVANVEPDAENQNFFEQWLNFWPFSDEKRDDIEFPEDLGKYEDSENDSKNDTPHEDRDYDEEDKDENDDESDKDANDDDELSQDGDDEENEEPDENDQPDDDLDEDDNANTSKENEGTNYDDDDNLAPFKENEHTGSRAYDEGSYSSKYRFNYRKRDDSMGNRFDEFDSANDYEDKDEREDDLDRPDEDADDKDEPEEDDKPDKDRDSHEDGNDELEDRDEKNGDWEQEERDDDDDEESAPESDVPGGEERPEDADENKTEDETTTANVVTKLGVGIALIIVAYTVVIRKWNNYADLLDQVIFEDANEEDQNREDYEYAFNDEDSFQENRTLQEYLETPTASESEDSKVDNARWSSSGADILAQEIEDSDGVTSESGTNDSDVEPTPTYDRYMARDYEKANITNQYDWQQRQDLDDADEDFDGGRIDVALDKYRRILRSHGQSVRAKYGIARVLDLKAEQQKSNRLLAEVVEAYEETLRTPDIPDALLKKIVDRAVNRMRFKGEYDRCISVQSTLVNRFPNEVKYQNDLVVTLLMLNRIPEAKAKLEDILRKWPRDELAAVHYGFVLKLRGQLPEAVEYLNRGIRSSKPGTQDSRFYFHLGDALQRLRREDEAMAVYERGVEKGLFLSKFQRSLYNVDRLSARPWWSVEQTTYQAFFRTLEMNWKSIRDEALAVLKGDKSSKFREEAEQLREIGDWRQLELFSRGMRRPQCELAPLTCRLISNFQPAAGCSRGQSKFSVMEPGTHVWPHCGPTNCRLRAHLGLVVPANVSIRVGEVTRSWEEGKVFVFDDSFEHEVWHNGSTYRLILIVDVWHPELTQRERSALAPI